MKPEQKSDAKHHLDDRKRVQIKVMERESCGDELPGKRFPEMRDDHLQYSSHEEDESQKKPQYTAQPVVGSLA
jgi:hypothetical protein